jgi:hypothetical protein
MTKARVIAHGHVSAFDLSACLIKLALVAMNNIVCQQCKEPLEV